MRGPAGRDDRDRRAAAEPGLIEPQAEALIARHRRRISASAASGPSTIRGKISCRSRRPQAYFEPINWHRTALHELGHGSGHASRLNRDLTGSFGSKKYAFEELVAEMAGAFVCASLGIVPTVRHADYIGSWLDVLREDNRAIVRAASAASKAADYLLGFQPDAPDADRGNRRPTTSRRRRDVLAPVGFQPKREADIRASAFPAFRVCGRQRVRGLRRFS